MGDHGVGDTVDRRYRLERIIAEGGAGTVYEGRHLTTDRPVAVKLALPKYRRDEEVCARLLREGRALGRVRHPMVVEILDAGSTSEHGPFLVLELLRGNTLQGILTARGQLGISAGLQIGLDLCEALEAAHRRAVVHRDVKPGNIFLATDDAGSERLKLIDFGVAAVAGDAGAQPDRKLTAEGGVLGTAEYMPLEQLLGQDDLDERVDVYAVGVTLYEMWTGTVPFEGNHVRVMMQMTNGPEPNVRELRPDVSPELAEVVERALARARMSRWPSMRELRAALAAAAPTIADESTYGPPAVTHSGARRATTAETRRVPLPAIVAPPIEGLQRRRFQRVPYITPVTIRRPNGSTLYGRSEDISEGGLRVLTQEGCAEDERVMVRFALPSGRFLETEAVARWLRFGRGLGAAGYEFVALPAEALEDIRQYVHELAVAEQTPARD